MKSVFLTGGARSATLKYLLENGEEVKALIVPKLTSNNRRFEDVILVAIEYGLPVLPVSKENLKETIVKLEVDCLISCGFPYLISQEIIEIARYSINVHPTLLPKYRGYRSGPYIIINGEDKTGVTVHFITEDMDKGDIILQVEVELTKFDTPKSMYQKTQRIEGRVLFEALKLLKSDNFSPIKQNESEASEYKNLRNPEDSFVDANKSLFELYNEIRACDPDDYPAFFYIDGQKVFIRLSRKNKDFEEKDMI